MNESDDATRQQPTGGADGHDCCGGDKSKPADRGPPRADADKAPTRERPGPKVLQPQRTSGAGCGCGH